jgi:hypothetical protein
MKKLLVLLAAGAFAVAPAQGRVQTQTQSTEFEQLRTQLREKLSSAIEKTTPEFEKARQAAIALQSRLQGKNAAEQKTIMEQERARVQVQLQAGFEELKKVSAQIDGEMEQAKQQIMVRMQEKIQELKDIQTRIKAPGSGGN